MMIFGLTQDIDTGGGGVLISFDDDYCSDDDKKVRMMTTVCDGLADSGYVRHRRGRNTDLGGKVAAVSQFYCSWREIWHFLIN